MKIKLWPQTEMDFDDLEDRLDEEEQERARERRTRKNDETRMKSGRNDRRRKGTNA